MSEPLRDPNANPPAVPLEPARGPQDVYAQRHELTTAERGLLEQIINLSKNEDGVCWAMEKTMAGPDYMNCHVRWLRKLLMRLQKKGYIAITYRHRQGPLIKPLCYDPTPYQIGSFRRPNRAPNRRPNRAPNRRPDRAPLPNSIPLTELPKTSALPPAGDEAPLFDKRPRQFNPFRDRGRQDQRRPEQRLAGAVRDGTVLYAKRDGRTFTITSVRYSPTAVCLYVLPKREGEELEKVVIPLHSIGGWWFGR